MTVLSKYFDRFADTCEHNGITKQAFSYALVTSALVALTIKVTIPYVKVCMYVFHYLKYSIASLKQGKRKY